MDWNQLPPSVCRCCRALWQAGFEAYPVGGGVRDLLLGRQPLDWDVTTSAQPEQVTVLFPRAVPTGLRHGTVTLPTGDGPIEVTTFRTEGVYSDGRHPDAVRFDATLEQDLARRDFTVNAMALNRDGTVIDLFGGLEDLTARRLCCVGDPDRRFREDALRMLRAVRFSAQLKFELDGGLTASIRRNAHRAAALSAERVQTEVERTLLSPWPGLVRGFFELGLMAPWADGLPAAVIPLSALPSKRLERWAGLCGALLKTGAISSAEAFLRSLRLDGRTLRACAAGESLWRSGLPQDDRQWRHALAQYGPDPCRAAAAMESPAPVAALGRVTAAVPCVTVGQLALSGEELVRLGFSGPAVGRAQRRLLAHVLDYPEDNRADRLTALLEQDPAPHG